MQRDLAPVKFTDATRSGAGPVSQRLFLPAGVPVRGLTQLKNRQVYVSVTDAFQALVDTGAVSQAALQGLLVSPANQAITFPAVGNDIFPRRITVPQAAITDNCVVRGVMDAGNTGLAVSNRFFQFTLASPTTLTIRMRIIEPGVTGTGFDSSNIDLKVRTVDNELARDTAGNLLTPEPRPAALVETTGSRTLAAGTYVVEVNGRPIDPATGDFSNAAGGFNTAYTLEVTTP